MVAEPTAERLSEHPSPMHRMPSHEEEEKESGCCRCGSGKPSDQMVKPTNPDPAQIQRKCTDVLCILLLIACWVVMTGIGIVSIENGNPAALVAPVDYQGRICGVDHGVVNKPYGYYIDSSLNMVCLDECPSSSKNITGDVSAYEAMICMDDEVEDAYKTATDSVSNSSYYNGYSDLFNDGTGPCNFELETYTILYYCIFSPTAEIPNVPGVDIKYEGETMLEIADVDDESMSSGAFMEFVQDVITTRNYIFGFGFAVAFLTSFFYSWLMTKGMIHLLVWVCIMMSEALMLALGAYMYYTGTEWESDDGASTHSDTEINGMKGLGITFLAIAGLFFCFICCNCSKIRKCCDLVQTAGQAVRDVPITVFFPIVQTGGLVIFMVPWMYYMVAANAQGEYVETTVNTVSNTTNEVWEWTDTDQYYNTFLMFSYFWTSQFITALGQLIMALTFAKWYFTEDPPVDTNAPAVSCCRKCWCGVPHAYRGNGLFFSALKAGLWYHAGTAAAGSLIIAIVKTIRYLIAKVQYYCEKSTSGAAKKIAQVVLCCIQCCLYCVEKCMKFINKHAYIITAVKGLGFCSAAVDAFWLIARNITLIASMTLIQEFVMIIGKIAIVSATGACSYVVMEEVFDDTEVNSYVGPVLFVMVLAYFIADMFMVTYSMAIDTVMHCYIADKEMYGSETKGAFCTRPGCSHLAKISELIKKTAAEDKVVEDNSETMTPIN